MNAKEKEKRVLKGYKIRDTAYQKALKRARREKTSLAKVIEDWVTLYSKGYLVCQYGDQPIK